MFVYAVLYSGSGNAGLVAAGELPAEGPLPHCPDDDDDDDDDDSEYEPDSQVSDSSLSPIIPLPVPVRRQSVKKRKLLLSEDGDGISCAASEGDGCDSAVVAAEASTSDGKREMESQSITVVSTESQGHRSFDKRYYCLYCDRAYAKIRPHLLSQHSQELDVGKMMSLTDKHQAACHLLKLRNLGNHKHNYEVLTHGKGEVVVVYRPKNSASSDDYVPCPDCYGYYAKSQLWKHCKKRCVWKKTAQNTERRSISRGQLLLPVPDHIKTQTWEVLRHLRDDEVKRAIVNDSLIIQFAHKLTAKHFSDPDKHEHVRCKLRELGRLVVQLKQEHKVHSLADALDPTCFKNLVSSVHKVCGFSYDTTKYSIPSLALKLGHSLKKCSMILISEALQTGSKDKEDRGNAFVRLCDIEWSDQISAKALKTLHDHKLNKVTILPLAADISKMTHYLSCESEKAMNDLQVLSESNHTAWITLSEVTLAQVILFNRRRVGEVAKMKVSDYESATVGDVQSDITEHLTELEKRLCHMLTRVQVVGKCGNHVPILLTSRFNSAFQMIISKRGVNGVPDSNDFVFARPSSGSHLRGSDVMRKYAEECGAQSPETLRGTALRKHIATVSQVLNLRDNELDVIAQFMGHNIKIHRDFYRLPSEVLQTAKVAKLLMAIETGQHQRLTGQSLDDVNIDLEEGDVMSCFDLCITSVHNIKCTFAHLSVCLSVRCRCC